MFSNYYSFSVVLIIAFSREVKVFCATDKEEE